MNEFHLTRMGNQYYTSTLPRLVKALERLNELLEKIVEQQGRRDERPDAPSDPERSSR